MERRAIPRKPVLISGTIQFAAGMINCLVRDMSITGAALDVSEPHSVPERFNLVFKADGTHIPCHVVWRVRTNGSAWPSTNPRRSSSTVISQVVADVVPQSPLVCC